MLQSDIPKIAPTPLRVLVVDDSEEDALQALQALREGGYAPDYQRVWSAETLAQALEERWDAVLSDHSMPGFSGLAALDITRRRDPDIPFLIVSGAIGEDTAVAAMRAGAQGYVMQQDLSQLAPTVRREMKEAAGRRSARLAQANLRSSEALLNSIVNSAADGILLVSGRGDIEFVNPAIERMFGFKPIELIGKNISLLLPAGGSQIPPWRTPDGAATRQGGRETRARHRDGSAFSVELTASPMKVDGTAKHTVILRDISERLRAEERIRKLAHFDELSGLPNRVLFCQILNRALREAHRDNRALAVLFVDLDRFKLINDTLGHDVGDDVLRQVAVRLTQCLRPGDTVARFASDEFVVMMRDTTDTRSIAAAAQRILDVLSQPFLLEGNEYHLSASVGISTFPDDSTDTQMLLRNADIAMYRAKEQGKNNYQFHSPQMNLHSFERLVLERFLRRALDQNEFTLHYQPKVAIGTGCVVGMEALLRWQNPVMGMVSPDKFIPLAEETGLIVPIGEEALRRACLETRGLHEQGFTPLRVAVNLSARQFAHDGLVGDIARVLADTGLHPDFLELEITESMVMHNRERAVALLRELREMGVRIAIDDFGTGYSSLGYLKRFPVDSVKIDRSFIQDIPSDSDDVAITRAVIAMAHSLRLQVTAEGVETPEQMAFLTAHSCDHLQGYIISRPLPIRDFTELIRGRPPFAETISQGRTGHPH